MLPSKALFAGGSKIAEAGYGWAPSSLLSASNQDLHSDTPKIPVQLTDQGLLIKCPGFFISWLRPPKESFYFEDEHNRWYKVTIPLADQQGSILNFDHSHHYPRNLALICQRLLVSSVTPSLGIPNMSTVLVNFVDTKDDVACVRFMAKVFVVERSGEDAVALECADRCIREGQDVVLADLTPSLTVAQRVQLEWDMDVWCGAVGRATASQEWLIM